MKSVLFAAFAIILLCSLSSCASLCANSASEVNINSNPGNARVQIFDRKGRLVYDGRTPALVTLKHASAYFRRAEYKVRITEDGYEPREVTLFTTVQGWYWGNFFIAGAIGFFIVDPATGAMYKFETHDIRETLSKSGQAGGGVKGEPVGGAVPAAEPTVVSVDSAMIVRVDSAQKIALDDSAARR